MGFRVCAALILSLSLAIATPPALSSATNAAVPKASDPLGVARIIRGASVQGRTLEVVRIGHPVIGKSVLVVGCIHGTECAGLPVIDALRHDPRAQQLGIWVLPNLNPDGYAAGTRGNARGVDLNRNSLWHWLPKPGRGDQQYTGRFPLSEPESRFATKVIRKLQPRVTIWLHQPIGLIDLSGGLARVERCYAKLVGMPVKQLERFNGSLVSWQNDTFPGSTAFVVEIPPGPLASTGIALHENAAVALARSPTAAVCSLQDQLIAAAAAPLESRATLSLSGGASAPARGGQAHRVH